MAREYAQLQKNRSLYAFGWTCGDQWQQVWPSLQSFADALSSDCLKMWEKNIAFQLWEPCSFENDHPRVWQNASDMEKLTIHLPVSRVVCLNLDLCGCRSDCWHAECKARSIWTSMLHVYVVFHPSCEHPTFWGSRIWAAGVELRGQSMYVERNACLAASLAFLTQSRAFCMESLNNRRILNIRPERASKLVQWPLKQNIYQFSRRGSSSDCFRQVLAGNLSEEFAIWRFSFFGPRSFPNYVKFSIFAFFAKLT